MWKIKSIKAVAEQLYITPREAMRWIREGTVEEFPYRTGSLANSSYRQVRIQIEGDVTDWLFLSEANGEIEWITTTESVT